ncbi:ATP-binding protein [Anaerobacillus isosaccharinicus]|uniref:histidine kinase n=1 Tax=Anaerobacillus isosaccharinicus TaxID=1532552 RepID=A0A1S2LLQ1_9BACI|nr:ATP-binding protein [Anaerobacillus isosaccharinicus]MBA5585115.1 PAS domain-containing protein [Anaerobacillus isosaccharinicus]QOY36542.1 PAS domain-containing protein [Anaerobacillus isosaccharinicus]
MKKNKILLIYIIFGLVWVLFTDYIVSLYVPPESLLLFQKLKGIFYILFTGTIIYFVLRKIEELNSSKEHKEKLSTLINSMIDFVNFKDGEGRWIEANNFGLKLFQLENVDYKGKKDSELAEYTDFYREALIYCESSDEETWKNGKVTRCEEIIPIPDGGEKHFDTIKVPLFNDDGSRKGLVVIGRDITDKKMAEEQVRRSEKLSIVGELAASVGHEIRNPLTSIKGFLHLLEEKDQSNKLYYEIMSKEVNRIDHIVGELLLLAKPQKLYFAQNDLKLIVSDIVSLLEPQANMTNVLIHYDPKEELMIECEENLLKQLFINIIKNAIEASSEKGNVWVKIDKESAETVLVKVEDEGSGISEDFLTRLGEPFYSSKEKGTGLGLTVSHKIVEQHGGTIHFNSEEGVGTKVEIQLPVKHESKRG